MVGSLKLARLGTVSILLVGLMTACADSPGPTALTPSRASLVSALVGNGDTAYVSSPVATPPSVKVTDGSGHGVAGVDVTFTVTEGGGTVVDPAVTTDAQGVASAGGWTLGPSTGENAVDASVAGLPTVHFTAMALSPYTIELHILGTPTAAEQAAVEGAVQRWRSIILSRLPDIPITSPANSCFSGQPAINETVSGMLLYVQFTRIDGVGKTLAESGPCYVRSSSSLPVVGSLVLDVADLPSLESAGQLQEVVTHEIGHILGFGTIWTSLSLLQGAGQSDPQFLGAGAIAAYQQLGGTGSGVPVENTGGTGTRDGHWRESVFGNELMTGYLNNGANPLSVLTVASMGDLGYVVDPSKADPYAIPTGGAAAGDLVPTLDIEPHEVLLSPRYTVDTPAH